MTISSFSGDYRFLSNFYQEPRRAMLTNEHFYQAAKALNVTDRATLMAAATPAIAKTLGRSVTLRPDWDAIKETVMLDGLRAKFFADVTLADMLLTTGDEILIEGNRWGDTYWGVCNGHGLNRLGELLMEVREEVRLVHQARFGG